MSVTENKAVEIETVSVTDGANDAATGTPAETVLEAVCDDQVTALENEIRELNDKYLRTAAELENTRRRAAIDADAAARRRAMGVASHFLPVMDAVTAALAHAPDDAGIIALQRAIAAAFAQIGIVKIESVGETLNPQFHNAIQAIAATDDKKPNTIIEELQAGYMFGDTVLRTAMVIVAK